MKMKRVITISNFNSPGQGPIIASNLFLNERIIHFYFDELNHLCF